MLNLLKASCGEGQRTRQRICKSELPLMCEGKDAETGSCSKSPCPKSTCQTIKMFTQYDNPCGKTQTQPQCEDEPWWHQERIYTYLNKFC